MPSWRTAVRHAVRRGAQGHRLPALRLRADLGVLLRAGQLQPDRPAGDLGGRRRQDLVRPDIPLAAEAAAGMRRDRAHVLWRDPERGAVDRRRVEIGLGGVPQGQPIAVPRRHRGRGLHRIVVARRLEVALPDGARRLRQARLDATLGLPGLGEMIRRDFEPAAARDHRHVALDAHPDERCGLLGGLDALGQHDRHRLAFPLDPVILHRRLEHAGRHLELAQARHVGGGEDADHTRHRACVGGIDTGHAPRGNRRADHVREQRAIGIDVRRVFGRTTNLARTLDTRVGSTDAHAFAPASTMARAAALTTSGTL